MSNKRQKFMKIQINTLYEIALIHLIYPILFIIAQHYYYRFEINKEVYFLMIIFMVIANDN